VDSTVQNYQSLVNNLRSDIQSESQVVVLDPQQNGVEQITQVLAEQDQLDSLHLLSHGMPGKVFLGTSELSLDNLDEYSQAIARWSDAFTTDAEILLYGCEVAADTQGQQFVQQLSRLTHTDIAASTTLTGHSDLGGDWELAYATGEIHTPLAFQPEAMDAYRSVLAELLNETFSNSSVTSNTWRTEVGTVNGTVSAQPYLTARPSGTTPAGGIGGAPTGTTVDAAGQGALRLTSSANNQSAFVLYDVALPSANGISITFDYFSYNGNGGPTGKGGDGINFFLVDAADTRTTTAGGFGGSLGYANSGSTTGIEGGYVGVGLDEFGNYSNATEGRVGGPGEIQDSIAVRGSEANGYRYLTGTGTLAGGIDTPGTVAGRNNAKKTAQMDITSAGLLTVKVDLNGDGDFTDAGEQDPALTNYNLVTNNGALPTNFKFGFASSTGAATNIHEIRNLVISDLVPTPAPTPTVALSLSGSPLAENGGVATVTATLSAASTSPVTVGLGFTGTATNVTDYTASGTSITIPAGSTSGSITLTGVTDTAVEGNETINVSTGTITGATAGTPSSVSATITDTPAPTPTPTVALSLSGSPLTENGGVATVTATLSAASTSPVTVGLGFAGTATNVTDYTASGNSITIPAGSTSGSITLTGVADTLTEAGETINVSTGTITGATAGTPNSVSATITDTPAPTPPSLLLSITGTPLAESGGVATVLATLSAPATSPVTVGLGFAGTATNGVDYTASSPTITIAAGQTFGTATLTGIGDTTTEGNETITVNAATVTGATTPSPQQVSATITDGLVVAPNTPPVVASPTVPAIAPGATAGITGLGATDDDGIGGYTITSVPAVNQGTLFLGDPSVGGTVVRVGQQLTGAQVGQIFFRAADGFTATSFSYTATDTRGATSAPQFVSFTAAQAITPVPEERRCTGEVLTGNRRGNSLSGRECNDRLRGRQGADTLFGAAGNDILNGGLGSDRLDGGDGNDLLKGRRGLDLLIGGNGNDTLRGGLRNDRLRGGGGDDIVDGGRGDDFVKGGAGNDRLTGRTGKDTLVGFGGDDRLVGGLNADVLVGGIGADTLTGNRGRDVFEYRSLQDGSDTITDFETNRDTINLRRISGGQSFDSLVRLSQVTGGTLVQVNTSNGLVDLATLNGVTASGLSSANFVV
jgi:hypothetical protein